ncbi:hypothetical protein H0E87_020658, partial [Populus deltoides]
VFDVDDDTVPLRFPNGFTFLTPGELVNNQSCRFSCSISFMLSNCHLPEDLSLQFNATCSEFSPTLSKTST